MSGTKFTKFVVGMASKDARKIITAISGTQDILQCLMNEKRRYGMITNDTISIMKDASRKFIAAGGDAYHARQVILRLRQEQLISKDCYSLAVLFMEACFDLDNSSLMRGLTTSTAVAI